MEETDIDRTSSSHLNSRWIVGVAFIGLVVIFFFVLMNWILTQRHLARMSSSQGRLSQLRLALRNYHEVYGSLPPAYLSDSKGKPLYSWRVLLLPFTDGEEIYNRYRLAEPWDSPYNLALAESCQDRNFFRTANDFDSKSDWTSIVAITSGNNEPIPMINSTGPGHEFIFVEMLSSGIHWAEPRDVSSEEFLEMWKAMDSESRPFHVLSREGVIGTLTQGTLTYHIHRKKSFERK
jgi:hypothetical protein